MQAHQQQPVTQFIRRHFKHFNSAVLKEAAESYQQHVQRGGKMMMTLAGAMSTAELGISLAEMIRQDKVHAISCTGANLEEDLYNLIGNKRYHRLGNYRELSAMDEVQLAEKRLNRVTDTCIPDGVMKELEKIVKPIWIQASSKNERLLPHELMFRAIRQGSFKDIAEIDIKDSWLVAACEKNIPLFVPGWEDSTLGNGFAASVVKKEVSPTTMRSGVEYMAELIDWYTSVAQKSSIGFFQIGGGIAGDFPICVVPTIRYDLNGTAPVWGYFCQISDSTTSFGSYSGAEPNEKITWAKLSPDTPRFVIESDASIVAPLMFAYVLGW